MVYMVAFHLQLNSIKMVIWSNRYTFLFVLKYLILRVYRMRFRSTFSLTRHSDNYGRWALEGHHNRPAARLGQFIRLLYKNGKCFVHCSDDCFGIRSHYLGQCYRTHKQICKFCFTRFWQSLAKRHISNSFSLIFFNLEIVFNKWHIQLPRNEKPPFLFTLKKKLFCSK